MTHHIHGQVATPEASRILQRLCYHFSRKITVVYDEAQGRADFPWGLCLLGAAGGEAATTLTFDCSASSSEELARVQYTIDEHIKLFSRKNPLLVRWEAPQTISK